MPWNWELSDWPHFTFDASPLISFETAFLQEAGGAFAVLKHIEDENRKSHIVEILTLEGLKSSKIEGEILDRDSLQSSIRRHFGLKADKKNVPPKEQGMASLMCHMYETFDEPLTHEMLFRWHEMLMVNNDSISDKGIYRSHPEPMQIVSGRYGGRVYFEAPPSHIVPKEMERFVESFNGFQGESILGSAALLHVYFESIHPFEDGNGRIGRALVEKFLSKQLGYPVLIAVSQVIQSRRKEYYNILGECNRTLEISHWVQFFSEVILEAQRQSTRFVHFLMEKSRLMTRLAGKINERQEKVLLRIFSEGVSGFSGGLSAENYIAITRTSRATATRDLADLVEKGALVKTGQLRHTRYWLNVQVSYE